MNDYRKDAGAKAEDVALAYLRQHGLQLIERNYRCRAGEIDLVMIDDSILALIEVRYRTGVDFGGAAASVTLTKQRRIANAARHLLLTHANLQRYRARFDVVAIDGLKIDWIRNAFEC